MLRSLTLVIIWALTGCQGLESERSLAEVDACPLLSSAWESTIFPAIMGQIPKSKTVKKKLSLKFVGPFPMSFEVSNLKSPSPALPELKFENEDCNGAYFDITVSPSVISTFSKEILKVTRYSMVAESKHEISFRVHLAMSFVNEDTNVSEISITISLSNAATKTKSLEIRSCNKEVYGTKFKYNDVCAFRKCTTVKIPNGFGWVSAPGPETVAFCRVAKEVLAASKAAGAIGDIDVNYKNFSASFKGPGDLILNGVNAKIHKEAVEPAIARRIRCTLEAGGPKCQEA